MMELVTQRCILNETRREGPAPSSYFPSYHFHAFEPIPTSFSVANTRRCVTHIGRTFAPHYLHSERLLRS